MHSARRYGHSAFADLGGIERRPAQEFEKPEILNRIQQHRRESCPKGEITAARKHRDRTSDFKQSK